MTESKGGAGGAVPDAEGEELVEALLSGDLIVVAGPRVAMSAGLPGPRELAERLAERALARGEAPPAVEVLDDLARGGRFDEAFSAAKDLLGPAEFGEVVAHALDDGGREVPELARAIAALAPWLRSIATTGLDRLLERALPDWPVDVRPTPEAVQQRGVLLKLRGTLHDRSTWVLTREDLEAARDAGPSREGVLPALYEAHHLLFLGFAPTDPEMTQLVTREVVRPRGQRPQHFAMMAWEVVSRYHQRRLEEAGIRLVGYRNGDRRDEELVALLRSLAARAAEAQPPTSAEPERVETPEELLRRYTNGELQLPPPELRELVDRSTGHATHDDARGGDELHTAAVSEAAGRWLAGTGSEEPVEARASRWAFIRALARVLYESGSENAGCADVMLVARQASKDDSLTFDTNVLDTRSASFLEHDEGTDSFRFTRRYFLEYFLAADIAKRLDDGRADALDLPRITPDVAIFLGAEPDWVEHATRLRALLKRGYLARVSENALLCLYFESLNRTGLGDGPRLGDAMAAALPARAQLRGANLSLLDLRWISLPYADLRESVLVLTHLDCADLRGADLECASASTAFFDGTRLDGVSFRNADVEQSSFVDASCVDVRWDGAERAGAVGLGAIMPDDTDPSSIPVVRPARERAFVRAASFASTPGLMRFEHPRIAFSEDGALITISTSEDAFWTLNTVDGRAYRIERRADQRVERPGTSQFDLVSPNQALRAAVDPTDTLRLYRRQDDRHILSTAFNDRGYISFVPNTPFFVSSGTPAFVPLVSGRRAMSHRLWAPLFERPDLVKDSLAGNPPDPIALGFTSYSECERRLKIERLRHGLVERRPTDQMAIEELRVSGVKLLADQTFSFLRPDGSLRRWTVFIGDNGLCKTTLLQAIALAASGVKNARALVDARSFCRIAALPEPATAARIEAAFRVDADPLDRRHLRSRLIALPGRSDFLAKDDDAARIEEIRGYRKAGYFVVGYGVGRGLPRPRDPEGEPDLPLERVRGLFDTGHRLIDLFDDLAKRELAEAFEAALENVLHAEDEQGERLLPWIAKLELGKADRDERVRALLEGPTFKREVGGDAVRLPPAALSQGYQAMLAWITDLLAHAFLEFGETASPRYLRGLVLLDEIDLHLHPPWQRRIVPILKQVFPELQFIVTTHSPLVLTGFEADEIIELTLDDGRVVQRRPSLEPAMQTASELLASYFDVPRAGRPDLLRKEEEYVELKARGSLSREEQERLQRLEAELMKYWIATPDSLVAPEDLGAQDERTGGGPEREDGA